MGTLWTLQLLESQAADSGRTHDGCRTGRTRLWQAPLTEQGDLGEIATSTEESGGRYGEERRTDRLATTGECPHQGGSRERVEGPAQPADPARPRGGRHAARLHRARGRRALVAY